MNDVGYTFIIISVILLLALIVGTFLYFKQSSELIYPKECPIVSGAFSTNPGKIGLGIVYQCGVNSTGECTFSNINSLSAAIDLCNQYLMVCSAFSYNPKSGNVIFINPTKTLSNSTNYDTYISQYPLVK